MFEVLHKKWNFDQVLSVSEPLVIRNCENFVGLKKEYAAFEDINEEFFKFVTRETFKKVYNYKISSF